MNINNSILLIDPAFDPSIAPACNLLVKIGMDSFSYVIINKSTDQVVALYDEQECSHNLLNLSERLEKDSYLNLPYQITKIAIYTEDEVSVPDDIFEDNTIELHSKLLKKNTIVNPFKQRKFGFVTIFGISKHLQEVLTTQLINVKMYPHSAGLLALAENAKDSQLFLDFSANSFTALFIKDEKLIFQKCYDTENVEELNYFILLLIDLLTINQAETIVRLSGIIHLDDSKYQCLEKYFNTIEFVKLDTALDLHLLKELPTHYYTNILALAQCV